MRYAILSFILLLLAYAPFASGEIIYVDADANDANDGTSWADAYNYVQEALANASNGDEIRIAQGIYIPWPPIAPPPPPPPPGGSQSNEKDDITIAAIDRTVTFQLISGVTVKGGYAGFGEPDPNARDIEMYETILSGDFNGDDGPDFANNAENAYHVVRGGGDTIIDGFTITGGNANGLSPDDRGGGMYNSSGQPTVTNCTFSGNVTGYNGGGMYNYYSNAALTNCTFSGNVASSNGGGMYNTSSNPILTNSRFSGNSAEYGGGMYNSSGQPTVNNCTFSGNYSNRGGGIYNAVSRLMLTNCTLSGNVASSYGGGMYNSSSDTILTNCILWGNTDIGGTNEIAQIHGGYPLVWFSCIQDDNPNDTYIPFEGNLHHNIDDDPMFVREPNDGGDGWGVGNNDDFGDLHLQGGSPCINSGDPYLWVDSDSVDMDGQPRIFDGRIDIGADEFVIPTIIVTIPEGGEVWAAGSSHEISWFSYDVNGTVDIRLSTDGGSNWPFIESGVPNTGSYTLQIPDTNDSNQCLISIVPSIPDPNVICIESGVFTIRPYTPGPAVESNWKSMGGNFERTGLSEDYGPEAGCVKWQFDANGPVSASVTAGFEGRVHIPCEDGKIYTLDANGVLLWSYDANSPLLSSPTIGPDGTIYVGSESGTLYAVDVNGIPRWTHPVGGPIYSAPAVSGNGDSIYVCSHDGILSALKPDGSKLWSFEMDGPAELLSATFASPAIGADGTIYIAGLYDPNLYALEPNNGSVKWSCSFEFPVEPGNPSSEMKSGLPFASPVVASDGTIYQTLLYDSNLCAIEPNNGTIIWSIDLADPASGWFDANYAVEYFDVDSWSEPALGPDGTIYVSFDDPYLRAVEPNGSIKWVVPIGNTGGFTLSVGNDGLIYAAGDDANLYVIDSNGNSLAEFKTDYWLSYPIIAAENTIIVSGINDEAVLTGDVNSTVWSIRGYGCADLNRDEFVNFIDFALLAAEWLNCTDPGYPCNYEEEEPYLLGDIDADKYVRFSDIAALAGKWLEDIEWLRPPPPEPRPPRPGKASNPNPPNEATGVSTTADLNWTAGPDATSHNVYFGASNPPSLAGNQTNTIFDPGTMDYDTMYYWQIDEVGPGGTTTGVVWSFTTHREGPPPPPG
ncbi:MAG: outer membrane protein assembly factor BamB family protein [Planctomycetota bacterium]|jgi:parallel beta-helix repeat protein